MNLKLHSRFPHKFIAEIATDTVPRVGEALVLNDTRYVVEGINHVFQEGFLVGRDVFVRRSAYHTAKDIT